MLIDVSLKVEILKNNNKFHKTFLEISLLFVQVHSIFAMLARGVFKTQSNIYKGAFCKSS